MKKLGILVIIAVAAALVAGGLWLHKHAEDAKVAAALGEAKAAAARLAEKATAVATAAKQTRAAPTVEVPVPAPLPAEPPPGPTELQRLLAGEQPQPQPGAMGPLAHADLADKPNLQRLLAAEPNR